MNITEELQTLRKTVAFGIFYLAFIVLALAAAPTNPPDWLVAILMIVMGIDGLALVYYGTIKK